MRAVHTSLWVSPHPGCHCEHKVEPCTRIETAADPVEGSKEGGSCAAGRGRDCRGRVTEPGKLGGPGVAPSLTFSPQERRHSRIRPECSISAFVKIICKDGSLTISNRSFLLYLPLSQL